MKFTREELFGLQPQITSNLSPDVQCILLNDDLFYPHLGSCESTKDRKEGTLHKKRNIHISSCVSINCRSVIRHTAEIFDVD